MRKCIQKYSLFFCLLLWATALTAAGRVTVSGIQNPDFGRIIFQTPPGSSFSASLNGNQLVITLSEPIEANFGGMLRSLSQQVASASLEEGGRRIRIRLKESNLRIRKFRGQNMFGVDLVSTTNVPKPAKDQGSKPIEKPVEQKKATPKPEKKKPEKKVEKKKQEVKKAPEKKAEKKAEKKPEKLAKEALAKSGIKKIEVTKTELTKPAPPPAPPAPVATKKSAAAAGANREVRTLVQQAEEVTRVMPAQATKLITIPWDKLVSAAVYVRGTTLWMVFDRPSTVELSGFSESFVRRGAQVPDRHSTVLRLELAEEAAKNADWLWMNREGTNWTLYYGRPPAEKPLLITTPEDTGNNEVKIVVRHASEPYNMLDQDIGDVLMVIPVRDPGNRILPGRRFVEFEIIPTIQGIVIVKRSEVPEYAISREGVRITSSNKLFTSSHVKQKVVLETPKGALETRTMYPFAHSSDPLEFMPIYYQYLKDLQKEPEATRSQVRLKMAEHLFLNAYYAESLGLLREILVDDPEFAAGSKIKPMIAGNLFMMGRFDQAQDTFRNILENQEMPEFAEEQKLWEWASGKMLDQHNLVLFKERQEFDLVNALNTYLPSYPYPLRRKLLLLFIQEQLAEDRVGAARNLMREVASLGPEPEESEMLDFLEARALLVEKKEDVAFERLQAVEKNATSARVRTLALLERTRAKHEQEKMTLPELIADLEKGRVEWRGDGVEFTLLKRLGEYYIANRQYPQGLRVWREVISNFSGTAAALGVSSDMANVFARLFDKDGEAYTMPPLAALSIFFEFNELLPVGAQGDRISRNLADYLASVDLLDNAAAILTHQVRFRSQGEDRAQLAAKLVDLHLANDRPDLAQEVFNAMAGEKIPPAIDAKFKILKAETLVQQGKYAEALKLLEADPGSTARNLRLAVFWKQQEWEQAIAILEPEVLERAGKLQTLSTAEEERALRLAIAYSKLRRFDELKALRTAYGKRIKNPQIGDALDFVTESMTPIDHTALEATLEMDRFRSFMGKYRLPEPPPPAPVPVEPAPKTDAPAADTEEKKEDTEEKPDSAEKEKKE